jgi:hypothetical protein
MSNELKKRISAFGWHTGMMVLAFAVDQILVNLGMLHLPEKVSLLDGLVAFNPTIVAGLVLGQVSKYIKNKVDAAKDNLG